MCSPNMLVLETCLQRNIQSPVQLFLAREVFILQSCHLNMFNIFHEHWKHVQNSIPVTLLISFYHSRCALKESLGFFFYLFFFNSTFRNRNLLEEWSHIRKFMILEQAPRCLAFTLCFSTGLEWVFGVALCFSPGSSVSKCCCSW